MSRPIARRAFLSAAPILYASSHILFENRDASAQYETPAPDALYPQFPSQNPARVREMVGASHGRIERVKELLAESPALAKASWDWAYGDWETALGAASHVGNREIAHLLMEHGARPDLFTFAMLGQLDVVKASVAANPGVQKITGPHGLTLLHHARKGGEEAKAVVEYLETLGDADPVAQSAPLSEEEMNALTGDFTFGAGADEKFSVTVKEGMLRLKRAPEGADQRLFHLGNHEFHPVGAPAVRVRFRMDGGKAMGLAVVDGSSTVAAERLAG